MVKFPYFWAFLKSHQLDYFINSTTKIESRRGGVNVIVKPYSEKPVSHPLHETIKVRDLFLGTIDIPRVLQRLNNYDHVTGCPQNKHSKKQKLL